MKSLNLIKKKRNFCSKLYKKERKKYYEMLDLKNVTDNQEFWKTVKPFLSDKVTTFLKISLVEKGEIVSDESKVAKSFSNFFENAIRPLGIKATEHSQENYDFKNPVKIAFKKFEQHPSINLINKNITNNENFHFSPADQYNILKEIINLDKKMELLKTFLLAASRVYQMCVVLFLLISGMKRFCLTKLFQKILNWRMLHLFLKRNINFLLIITDQQAFLF